MILLNKNYLLFFCFFPLLQAMELKDAPKTYDGAEINQETIVSLAPKAPEHIVKKAQDWLAQNPDFTDTALGYEKLIGTMKPFLDATNALLEHKGLKNFSPWNYVFDLPESDYLIKIGGHVNRKYNLMVLSQYLQHPDDPFNPSHYDYNRKLTDDDFKLFEDKLVDNEYDHKLQQDSTLTTIKTAPKTFQTISRIAHYLLFLDTVQKFKLEKVIAPRMYLVHIPGRPAKVSDRNYIVVEEKLKNLEKINALSESEIEELKIVVKNTGLFNITKENVFRADGKLVLVDFEQPNNSNPQHFFHKDYARFINNENSGLNTLDSNFISK